MATEALALYRKYRPRTFAEVVGQEHVTDALQQALRTGRIHHAYLFSGPRGCGKTSSARILARSLNCENGPTPDPCGKCDQCVAITNGTSLDVVEIDAASHGGVDDARDLRERAFFAPVSARYKVYIVDEAHMVSSAGFNALLKVVEEPPEFLKFVFATTEPQQVIGTIKSRTHHYPFRLIPAKALTAYLKDLCAREGVTVDPRAVPLVVRAGGGSARDSLSVLDQLIAGAGPDGVTYERAVALLGVTDTALLDEIVDAFSARDGAAVFATVGRVVEAGHDPRRFASDVLDRMRDLIVLQRVPEAAERDLVDAPPDELPRLADQAARFGPAELSRAADLFYAGLTEMRGTTSPRLVLELVCARVLLPAAATDEASVLARLDRLERRLEIGAPAPAPPPPTARSETHDIGGSHSTPPVPAPQAPEPPPEPERTGGVDAAAVRRVWDQILDACDRRITKALLANAQVTDVRGGEVVLTFTTSPLVRQFEMAPHRDVLRTAITQVLGGEWTVAARFGDEPAAASPATARVAVESFAPGDEAADDDGEPDATPGPRSGEDSAVELLKSGLGATVISESDPT